jgi:predicted GNAT family acetyltransferase
LYENEKPVATGAYYAFDTFSIENIGTLPEARGKGYAQIIVKKLLQEAKKL